MSSPTLPKGLSISAAILAIATAASVAPAPSRAAPSVAGALPQTAAPYRLTIGKAEVTAFSDCTIAVDMHQALKGITPEETDRLLAANFLSNPMETSINVFMIKAGGRTVLVDAGMGDPKLPGRCGRSFDGMATSGVRPDQVNDVVLTHLHIDHVGGLFWDGKMMFPNATIHLSKAELDEYLSPPQAQDARAVQANKFVMSILRPYLDAGKVKTFSGSGEILPGLTANLIPGHTSGSVSYTLADSGQALVFIGDYNPVPGVGFARPDVNFVTDQDRAKASAGRQGLLKELGQSGSLVAAPHLSFPGIGYVGADGRGYRWFPVEYSNRAADVPPAKF